MIWIIFSFGSGFFNSLQGVYSKKALVLNEFNDWTIMLVRFLYVLPVFIIFWFAQGQPTEISRPNTFWMAILVLVLLEVVSQWTFQQSIKISSLSLVTPFQSITPIFIVPINFLIFHDWPSILGFVGILVSTVGMFLLFESDSFNFTTIENKKSMRGILLMIITSILWALTTTIQKVGIKAAGASLFGLFYIGGIVLVILAYHLINKISLKKFLDKKNFLDFLPIGFTAGVSTLLQYLALAMTNPAYVNALKRSANVANLIWDKSFFKESLTQHRIIGNILSVIGTILIVLS